MPSVLNDFCCSDLNSNSSCNNCHWRIHLLQAEVMKNISITTWEELFNLSPILVEPELAQIVGVQVAVQLFASKKT